MVWRCVAAGCSLTYKDGVSLLHFLKDPALGKNGQIKSEEPGINGSLLTILSCAASTLKTIALS